MTKRKNKILKNIEVLLLDVDGVLTDGSVYVDRFGNELLRFSRIDGKGLELIKEANIKVAILSSENCLAAKRRAEKLKVDLAAFGVKDKLETYYSWKRKFKFDDSKVLFCCDDIQDLELMNIVGFSAVPSNAVDEVKEKADYVSKKKGGEGFVREICDMILNVKRRKSGEKRDKNWK
ncbi:MAG: hypothetical protein DRI36_00820 [Caldiserica bacterium]|nr:MAG: hypothetical protein DRI36_00820 [Caldisericota bacterium]